MIKRQNHQ